jgi:hypothetical protein
VAKGGEPVDPGHVDREKQLRNRDGRLRAVRLEVTLRKFLDWAAQQLTVAELARVDALVAERNKATVEADPVDFWRSRAQRSDAENARIGRAHRRRATAEREHRAIVDQALTAPDRTGEQLDLSPTKP